MKTDLDGPMDAAKDLELRFPMGDLDLPERKHISCRVGEEVDALTCPCGRAMESKVHMVEDCEPYKEERDVLEREVRDVSEGGMKHV